MPEEDIAQNVLGGIDVPRALICGPELWLNRSFEENTTGVASNGPAHARLFDTSTPFGDYSLLIAATTDEHRTTFLIETGDDIAGRRFVVVFYARSDGDTVQDLTVTTLHANAEILHAAVSGKWEIVVFETLVDISATGTQLLLAVYPFDTETQVSGTLRIDNFRCRKVAQAIELPEVSRDNLRKGFIPEVQTQQRATNGDEIEYNRRLRFVYESQYEQLDPADELNRRTILAAQNDVLFFPHKDSGAAYFVRWAQEDYQDGHAFGMAGYGNAGNVSLRGTEALPQVPGLGVDGYIFTSDEIYI